MMQTLKSALSYIHTDSTDRKFGFYFRKRFLTIYSIPSSSCFNSGRGGGCAGLDEEKLRLITIKTKCFTVEKKDIIIIL